MKVLAYSENNKFVRDVESILKQSHDLQWKVTIDYRACVFELGNMCKDDIFIIDCCPENFRDLGELKALFTTVKHNAGILPVIPEIESPELYAVLPYELLFYIPRNNLINGLLPAIIFASSCHLFRFPQVDRYQYDEKVIWKAIERHGGASQLSKRHKEIIASVVEGMSNEEIGDKLCIAVGTVKWYLTKIYKALNITNRSQIGHALMTS